MRMNVPKDLRPIISGSLAVISLLGTIVAMLCELDAANVATLAGFTGTFGAYALGIQSEVRK